MKQMQVNYIGWEKVVNKWVEEEGLFKQIKD